MKQKKKRILKPTAETFDERFKWITEVSIQKCKDQGDFRAHAMAFDPYDHMHILINFCEGRNHATDFANLLRRFFREKQIREYYFISTGWAVYAAKHEEMARRRMVEMAERRELHLHPDRREVLWIIGVRGTEKRGIAFQINRDSEQNVIELRLLKEMEGAEHDGTFPTLLDTLPGH